MFCISLDTYLDFDARFNALIEIQLVSYCPLLFVTIIIFTQLSTVCCKHRTLMSMMWSVLGQSWFHRTDFLWHSQIKIKAHNIQLRHIKLKKKKKTICWTTKLMRKCLQLKWCLSHWIENLKKKKKSKNVLHLFESETKKTSN